LDNTVKNKAAWDSYLETEKDKRVYALKEE